MTIRGHTPETITEAVLEQMEGTKNARLKEIIASAVRHLHAFAREVDLTPAEWLHGIEFMTEVGQLCSPGRQEFMLLSDTLGLSALVNALYDRTAGDEATHTSLLGRSFRENAPHFEHGAQISNSDPSDEIVVWGRVTDARRRAIPGAKLMVWQTGSDGRYDMQVDPNSVEMRGVFHTDPEGGYLFRSVRPLGYYIPLDGPVGRMIHAQQRDGMRPAHIHFRITAPGYRELVTAIYLDGDENLEKDVLFGASADLTARLRMYDPNCPLQGLPSIHFDFSLARQSAADRLGESGGHGSLLAHSRRPVG